MWTPYHREPAYAGLKYVSKQNDPLSNAGGFLLPYPKTELIDSETIVTPAGLEIGHSSMQGYRRTMEDAHIIESFDTLPDHTLVAVLDGHAGAGTAIHASCRLPQIIEETSQWQKYVTLDDTDKGKEMGIDLVCQALVQAYINLDAELRESDFMDGSGSTAISAIITPTHVICANVGDSRCVIGTNDSKANNCISMSEDHKPQNSEESQRITDAGGFVMYDRVNGELAMSRALGDFQYKDSLLPISSQMVTCYPDVSIHIRNENDNIVLLACDGIFDVMSNEDAINYLLKIVPKVPLTTDTKGQESSQGLAESLIRLALSSGSTDNLSALIVKLASPSSTAPKSKRQKK